MAMMSRIWCCFTVLLPGNSNTLGYYNIDPNTGYVTSTTPYKTQSYTVTQRPWYVAGISSAATYTTLVYGSVTSNSLQFGIDQKIVASPTQPYNGVCATAIQLQTNTPQYTLSMLLLKLNTVANTVLYIMQTSTDVLLATSVGESLSATKTANMSTNTYIAGSANFINMNKITKPVSMYSKALGYSITVKFYTQGSGSSLIQWTIVAADYGNTTVTESVMTTYSGNDDSSDNTSTDHQVSAVLAIVATLLVLNASFFAYFVMTSAKKTPPMATTSNL